MTKKQKNMKLRISLLLIICAICAISFIWQNQLETALNNFINPPISTDVDSCELKVHFIYVGQGDSILIELPDDKIMLIDSGPGDGEKLLVDYLNFVFQTREDRVIDYFLITHQDEDHVGGADKVFDNFDVENFYRPNVYTQKEAEDLNITNSKNICKTGVFGTMITKMEEEGCLTVNVVEGGSKMLLDESCGYEIEFITPLKESYSNANDYSPMTILTYKDRKFLFTGDAETAVESELIAVDKVNDIDVDVLKVGHHGSNSSSGKDFLKAISPEYAVICVGIDNTYKHPTESTLENLKAEVGESNIYRTDIDGNIIVGVDKDEETHGKASIKIATNGELHQIVNIKWWYVVVIVIGASFVILILPAKKQKQIAKKIKAKK